MNNPTHRLALVIGLLCVVLLILGCAGWWQAFGIATWPLIYLCAALGFGRESSHKAIWLGLLAMLVISIGLMAAVFLTEQNTGSPRLVLGAPVATAVLIYGIWPFGILLGVIYFRVFDRHVLPKEKLDAFLSEFGERTE